MSDLYKLMLVDDEPWALSGMEEIIDWQSEGFSVAARCECGKDALSAARLIRPDAVITDIRMPDMSGLDLIRKLREILPDIQCVIVSAYSDFEVAREAIRLSALYYLLKPISASDVYDAARALKNKLSTIVRPKEKVLETLTFDLDHFQINPPVKGLTGYLFLSDEPFYLPLPEKNTDGTESGTSWKQPVVIGNYTGYLTDYPPDMIKEKEALPEEIGVSIGVLDCAHSELMLRTALASLEGGFFFAPCSGKKQISAYHIQLYLAEHMEEDVNLSGLAACFYLTETYLCDLFKKQTGESIMNFLRRIRLHKAKRLLAFTNLTLREVACRCGYADYSYFGRQFKAESGVTPDLYRKEKRLS